MRPRRRTKVVTIVAILILDLFGTAWGWIVARKYEDERDRQRFLQTVETTKKAIAKRMLDHEQILRAGRGLFAASEEVSREQWRKFVGSLELAEVMPGIQGVGFTRYLSAGEGARFLAAEVRAEGFPDFRIWPEGGRETYTAIVYLEPFEKRNLRAFGYDMYSEPVRREAMTVSRDSGVAVISGKVTLVQETETGIQSGILMYLPVYTNGLPASTVEERRAAIRGFTYSPYRMNDLMQGILGHSELEIDLEIYDGTEPDSSALLYAALNSRLAGMRDEPRISVLETIRLYGRTWTLRFASTSQFEVGSERTGSILVLLAGLLVTASVGAHLIHEYRESSRSALLESASHEAVFGRVAATIAHEINNPLAAIRVILDLLKGELPEDSGAREDVEAIEEQSDRVAETVRSLLEFTRQRESSSSGTPTLEILRNVGSIFEKSLRANGITLCLELPAALPEVSISSRELQDILVCLLERARKLLKGGVVQVSAGASGDVVEILLEDDGPGLGPAPERLLRLRDASSHRLDLVIASRLCKLAGGRLEARNRKPFGAAFRILLPTERDPQ